MNTIPIVEIFGPSIQGEGPNVGARCIFVRVKGCSFRCKWCDSAFTWNDHESEVRYYAPEELAHHLIEMCKMHNCKHVVLTGGNPCIYDFSEVVQQLACSRVQVDVETQGDFFPDWLIYINTIVLSPKAPSSGMPDTYEKIVDYISNELGEESEVAIKIPVFDKLDIEFARKYAQFASRYNLIHNKQIRLYLSVGNSDVSETGSIRDRVLSDYETLLNTINEKPEDFQNVYLLPQLHTLVWGNKQGV